MSTSKKWTQTLKPQEEQILMTSFISTVTNTGLQDITNLNQTLKHIDKTLSRMYAPHCYDPNLLYQEAVPTPNHSNTPSLSKLSLPKDNTLTDALIKNTLGCDQKYAKQYMELISSTDQESDKRNRIQKIKDQFTTSNTFVDVTANSKPFFPKTLLANNNPRPVVDNQHQAYLKTQLILMEKPNNSKLAQKQYYEKHYETITQQIESLGGIQDTLSKMETTLKNHQIQNFKNRSLIKEEPELKGQKSTPSFQNTFMTNTPVSQSIVNNNWIEKSKQLRQQFMNKMSK